MHLPFFRTSNTIVHIRRLNAREWYWNDEQAFNISLNKLSDYNTSSGNITDMDHQDASATHSIVSRPSGVIHQVVYRTHRTQVAEARADRSQAVLVVGVETDIVKAVL